MKKSGFAAVFGGVIQQEIAQGIGAGIEFPPDDLEKAPAFLVRLEAAAADNSGGEVGRQAKVERDAIGLALIGEAGDAGDPEEPAGLCGYIMKRPRVEPVYFLFAAIFGGGDWQPAVLAEADQFRGQIGKPGGDELLGDGDGGKGVKVWALVGDNLDARRFRWQPIEPGFDVAAQVEQGGGGAGEITLAAGEVVIEDKAALAAIPNAGAADIDSYFVGEKEVSQILGTARSGNGVILFGGRLERGAETDETGENADVLSINHKLQALRVKCRMRQSNFIIIFRC